jgi:hypothetical protein
MDQLDNGANARSWRGRPADKLFVAMPAPISLSLHRNTKLI